VTIKLEIVSPAAAEQVKKLAAHAERACHAAQSLRHPVPVSLETALNGARLED
jgi:organic hydroperoxide reductase OsmC/OhrA